jgi:hypothetical protein
MQPALHLAHQPDNFFFGDKLTINLNPLPEGDQVRRGEKPDAQTRGAINALQHRGSRAFAVRSRNVNEPELVLWVTSQRGQL